MRLTNILDLLATGVGEEEIVADFDYVTREDIRACLAFAGPRHRPADRRLRR